MGRVSDKVLPLPRRRKLDLSRLAPSARSLASGLGLVALAAGLYLLARQSSMFAVTRVDVSGAGVVVATQARAALASVQGRSLLALDAATVVRRLEALPTVYSASYDRDFPHTLRIRVVPERPVAVLRRGVDSWLVSARGRVIALVPRRRFRGLPRIWLPSPTAITVGATLSNQPGGIAARSLRAFVGSGLAPRTSYVRAQDGQLVLGLRDGLAVRLGAPVDLSLKAAVVRQILPTLATPSGGGPQYLDVAVPERPVAGRNPRVRG